MHEKFGHFRMLIAVRDFESETFTISRCENDWEYVMYKLSEIVASVRCGRFPAAFFWIFLTGNWEPRLASEIGRNILSVFILFSHGFVCLSTRYCGQMETETRQILRYNTSRSIEWTTHHFFSLSLLINFSFLTFFTKNHDSSTT